MSDKNIAETSNPKLQTRLREIAESLLCRGGTGHYCPNCDNTTFDAAMSLKLLADQIGLQSETPDALAEVLACLEPKEPGWHSVHVIEGKGERFWNALSDAFANRQNAQKAVCEHDKPIGSYCGDCPSDIAER